VAIHGGSIVVVAQRLGGPRRVQPAVPRLLERELAVGLHRMDAWRQFAGRVATAKESLLAELDRLAKSGKRVVGYGAPAKGMTLLAYCGVGPERLPYVVDRSPYKQGMLTPGHHIPVYGPEKLLDDQPDVALLLAWNFAEEIVRQQAVFQQRGGKFLLPLPTAHYWHDAEIARLKLRASA
jgi:hypothetical protein